MRRFWILMLILGLAACGNPSAGSPAAGPTALPTCGDNICASGETSATCPQDCPVQGFSGKVQITYVNSNGIGKIAVLVASPKSARYTEGAGVVVIVSPFFTDPGGFQTDPNLTSIGLIQVSYLWPGLKDSKRGVQSEGTFDYGGEQSTQVLRDVTRFAAGRIPDANGRGISALTSVPPLTDEVGLYAFSDAGIAAINLFSLYSDQLAGVQYYIGRETPTLDTLSCLEAGYFDDSGQPAENPFYHYPAGYSPAMISLNYANLRWDPTYSDAHTGSLGRPYLDLDGSGSFTSGDYPFGGSVPVMFGKRYYSVALTQALLNNGVLSLDDWPADLATPTEAAQVWPFRQSTPDRFVSMRTLNPNLDIKVMLVFAIDDHAQAAPDKPHIHQVFQGFRFNIGLWVRLNPDRAYVQSLAPKAGTEFPDNPVNTQPEDWTKVAAYAYPGNSAAGRLVPLAAVAEMADRAHTGRWDENIGQPFYTYTPPTPQP